MFVGFGISGPFQPRPRVRRERYFGHFTWLWLEVVWSRHQFIEIVARTTVEYISDQIPVEGDTVTFRRER